MVTRRRTPRAGPARRRTRLFKYPVNVVARHLLRSLPVGQLRVFAAGTVVDRPVIPSAIGRTTLSASGGAIADMVGWSPFFVLATLACLPGLGLLVWIMRLERAGEH